MSVLRNLAIDRRRPRSWLRSAGAGTSATIAADQTRRSRHHRRPEFANNNSLKRNC